MNLLTLLMAGLLSSGNLPGTALIAHRGASFDAPENTLAALRLGYEQGADAAECDIQLSEDGAVVVIHDRDTARVAHRNLPVSAQSAAALGQLNVSQWGKWKGSAFSDAVPLLSEVLAIVPAGKRLFIELKVGAEILPALERVIRTSGGNAAQLPLITFDLETARVAKKLLPTHEVCWIVDHPKTGRGPDIESLIQQAKDADLDGLDLNGRFPIDKEFVKKVHHAGLKLYTWTVDDPGAARAQAAAGVDGITTNRPGWLRQQLSKP